MTTRTSQKKAATSTTRASVPKKKGAKSTRKASVAADQARNELAYKRVFTLVAVAVIIAILAGFGPVWLSAEATRSAQHSELLKAEIAETLGVSERLELERCALLNSTHIVQTASKDLGMVPEGSDYLYIELGMSSLVQSAHATLPGLGFSPATNSLTSAAKVAAGSAAPSKADAAGATTAVASNTGTDTGFSLVALARLTAGEASTLLVGDVGLAGLR